MKLPEGRLSELLPLYVPVVTGVVVVVVVVEVVVVVDVGSVVVVVVVVVEAATVNVCVTWFAGAYVTLPGSLKSMVQEPIPVKLTTPATTVQTPVVDDVIDTRSPDVATALGVYVGPPTNALIGGVVFTVMPLAD